ncbi:MAG: hypothetical protein KGY75_09295, partial [Candidatus Cloacimonetes bacterium]|nr:hypothetical protein [Candidatus Cloacimonadota bacterium]
MKNSNNYQTTRLASRHKNKLQICIEKKYQELNKKFSYIIDNFLSIYEIEFDIIISFGDDIKSNSKVHIRPGINILDFFSSRKEIPSDYIFKNWRKRKLPFFFTRNGKKEIISNLNGK